MMQEGTMEFVRGMIVRATAGRDQGGFFTVLSVEGDYAMICNGKRRPLEQPKKKKLKHLAPTHTAVSYTHLRRYYQRR